MGHQVPLLETLQVNVSTSRPAFYILLGVPPLETGGQVNESRKQAQQRPSPWKSPLTGESTYHYQQMGMANRSDDTEESN